MKFKNSFIALSNILDAAAGASRFCNLDQTSKSILIYIGHQNSIRSLICITDIIENSSFENSKVTLLKKTQMLIKLGWLEERKSELHHRRNDLLLSRFALKELDMISKILDKTLKKQDIFNEC